MKVPHPNDCTIGIEAMLICIMYPSLSKLNICLILTLHVERTVPLQLCIP